MLIFAPWQIITMTGWGNFGENLLANLWLGEHTYYPIVLKTQRQYDQVPILREMWLSQSHLPTHFQSGYGYGEQVVPFPVMHSISGAFEKDIRLQVYLVEQGVMCNSHKTVLSIGRSVGTEKCCFVFFAIRHPLSTRVLSQRFT